MANSVHKRRIRKKRPTQRTFPSLPVIMHPVRFPVVCVLLPTDITVFPTPFSLNKNFSIAIQFQIFACLCILLRFLLLQLGKESHSVPAAQVFGLVYTARIPLQNSDSTEITAAAK